MKPSSSSSSNRLLVALIFFGIYLILLCLYRDSIIQYHYKNDTLESDLSPNTSTMAPIIFMFVSNSPSNQPSVNFKLPPRPTYSPIASLKLTPSDYRVKESSTDPKFTLNVHPKGDVVSDQFYDRGYWPDCIEHLSKINKLFGEKKKLVIVDVGANIGSCSMLFASKTHKVYSFEPLARNFALLNKSIQENKHLEGRIVATNAGIGPAGTIHMSQKVIYSETGNFGNSIVEGGGGKDDTISKEELYRLASKGGRTYTRSVIHMTTLDHVIKEHVNYMKLDCQGCELKALRGATTLLKVHGVDLIRLEFAVDWIKAQKEDPLDLLLLLQSYNYTIYKQDGARLESSKEAFKQFIKKFENTIQPVFEDIIAFRKI